MNLQFVWYLDVAVEFLLFIFLVRVGRVLPVPAFRAFLGTSVAVSLLSLEARTDAVRRIYPDSYPILFIAWGILCPFFYYYLCRELVSLVFSRFEGIFAASRRALAAFWTMSILFGCAWFIYLSRTPDPDLYKAILLTSIRYHNAAALSFTLFVLFLVSFVCWMPVPLTRNVLVHCFVLTLFFVTFALSRLLPTLGSYEELRITASVIGVAGCALASALWLFLVNERGREGLVTPRKPLNHGEVNELLGRLDQLDQTLSRSGSGRLR